LNTKFKICIQLSPLCFNLNLAHRKRKQLIEEKKWDGNLRYFINILTKRLVNGLNTLLSVDNLGLTCQLGFRVNFKGSKTFQSHLQNKFLKYQIHKLTFLETFSWNYQWYGSSKNWITQNWRLDRIESNRIESDRSNRIESKRIGSIKSNRRLQLIWLLTRHSLLHIAARNATKLIWLFYSKLSTILRTNKLIWKHH
jgi:hypothetical protein